MKTYLAFDVGGTFTKYAFITEAGEVVEKSKYPTAIEGENANKEYFAAGIEKIYRQYKDKVEIIGIAVSMPGQIDVENGIVYGGGALPFLHEVEVGKLISERCDGIRVALENDGKCAALAEVWKGNAKDAKDACVLIIGTAVGGGVIIDRKVHRGKRMLAGEFSYCLSDMTRDMVDDVIPIETAGGVLGAFEKMPYLSSSSASAAGLCYKAAKLKNVPYSEMSGELIYKLASEGDEDMINILEDLYFCIAKLCVNLYITIDADVILIGGGISAEPKFVEGIRKYVDKIRTMGSILSEIKIDTCKFRNDSNLLGAVYNFNQLYDSYQYSLVVNTASME